MIPPNLRWFLVALLLSASLRAGSLTLTGVTPVSSSAKGTVPGNTAGADPSTFAFGLSPAATIYFLAIIPGATPTNYRAWEGRSALAATPASISRPDAVLGFRNARAYVRQAFRIDITELTFVRTDNPETFEADRALLAQLVAAKSQAEFAELCRQADNRKACLCAEAVLSELADKKFACPPDL